MNMDMTKLNEAREQLKNMREEVTKQSRELLLTAFKGIFEAYPQLRAITWCQYTPYFNDGDTCVFSVCDVFFIGEGVTDEQIEEGKGSGGWYFDEIAKPVIDGKLGVLSSWSYRVDDDAEAIAPGVQEAVKSVSNFMSENEDSLLEMFGDHAAIFATREGFAISEYEHD